MIIALSYDYSEQDQAARLAARIRELGHCEAHTLVLACERSVTKRFFSDLLATFEDVLEFDFTDRVNHYPESKNLKFQQCALFVRSKFKQEKHWLYLEADVVPIRETWADEIAAEAATSSQPFIGPVIAANSTHRTPAHMGAVAVYPVDMISAGAGMAMNASELPWPAVIARATTSAMLESKLICHDWEGKGVPDGCALYHPDRDGKILESLSGRVESRHSDSPDKSGERSKGGLMASAHSLVQPNNESGSSAPPAQNRKGEEEAVLVTSPSAEPANLSAGAGSNPAPSTIISPDEMAAMLNSQPEPELRPRPPIVDAEGCFVAGLGKTHPEPWEDRLGSEQHIKFLARELKSYCTRPAYSAYVRKVLRAEKVTAGKPRGRYAKRRK